MTIIWNILSQIRNTWSSFFKSVKKWSAGEFTVSDDLCTDGPWNQNYCSFLPSENWKIMFTSIFKIYILTMVVVLQIQEFLLLHFWVCKWNLIILNKVLNKILKCQIQLRQSSHLSYVFCAIRCAGIPLFYILELDCKDNLIPILLINRSFNLNLSYIAYVLN
jgi:hypothetical protein